MTALTTNIATNTTNDIFTITFTTMDKDWYEKVYLLCKEAVDEDRATRLQDALDQFRRNLYLSESIKQKEDTRTCNNCRYSGCQHEPCIHCCADGDHKMWAPVFKEEVE